jgi:hypothetical protein
VNFAVRLLAGTFFLPLVTVTFSTIHLIEFVLLTEILGLKIPFDGLHMSKTLADA